jgi:hypothetical protein
MAPERGGGFQPVEKRGAAKFRESGKRAKTI